ncbi:MAG: hypothetical protein WCA37_06330 [Terracidiphilus sp.]
MRLCCKHWMVALLLAAPVAGLAANCTTQAALSAQDRNTIAAVGNTFAQAVLRQDEGTLQAALLPAVQQDWPGMKAAVEDGAALVKGGQVQLRALYLLDNSSATAPADQEFFCSNVAGTLTITITMRALPPGRYAVVLADAAGSALGGQMGFVLVWDPSGAAPTWKLGGLSVRQGIIEGHDGIWYWTHARVLAAGPHTWSAWYTYELARYLLLPVDFLTSNNLDKLVQEQGRIMNSPAGAFPYSLADGPRTWKIHGIRVDTSLHEADLGITYESLGVTDPSAQRTEAIAVMSALLKSHPGIRQNFHGLWAYASTNGKIAPIIELPMGQIP